jgi:hypothetical protein
LKVARTRTETAHRTPKEDQNHSNTTRAGTTRDTNPKSVTFNSESWLIENPTSTEVGHLQLLLQRRLDVVEGHGARALREQTPPTSARPHLLGHAASLHAGDTGNIELVVTYLLDLDVAKVVDAARIVREALCLEDAQHSTKTRQERVVRATRVDGGAIVVLE